MFGPRGRWIILLFPIGLLSGGAALSVWMPHLRFVEFANIAAIAGIGLLYALALRLSMPVFISLCLLVGLANGYENAEAMLFNTGSFPCLSAASHRGGPSAALALALITLFLKGPGGWRDHRAARRWKLDRGGRHHGRRASSLPRSITAERAIRKCGPAG